MSFNKNFYTPKFSYTREQAELILKENGITEYHFKSSSFTNGASFYFEDANGREIRVSDHPLTGKRAFTTIELSLVKRAALPTIKKETKPSIDIEAMIARRNAKFGTGSIA